MRYSGNELASEPYQSYSVLRAKFDRHFAKQVERKGAAIVTKTKVDDVIIEEGKVKGVWAAGDELRADVVIACDGVMSLISERVGLKSQGLPKDHAVGFKEVIELDPAVIEDRFGLMKVKVQPVYLWVKSPRANLEADSYIQTRTA